MKTKISASLACANPINIQKDFEDLEKSCIDLYHIDLCDGVFAPTFLLNSAVIKALRRLTKRRLDVHIYGHHPSKYLDELKRSGTDVVIVHVETEGEDYIKTIQEIRRMGMKAGVAILPTSQVPENISQVLPLISVVVANTVGPAYAGQTFNVAGVQNMKKIHDIAHDLGLTLEFAADGSVSSERLPLFLEAGANHFILGTSSLFLGNNLPENARIFQENLSSEIEKMTKR